MKQNLNMKYLHLALLLLVFSLPSYSHGNIISFTPTGAAGEGLLAGNIDPIPDSTGFGGVGGTGIFFNTETNVLSVDILWGSEFGFGDLTGDVALVHLHGPVDPGPAGFGQVNPDILVPLQNSLSFVPTFDGGSLIDNFFLDDQQEQWLLDSRTYINIHTDAYPFGEIRGYLQNDSVPEPATGILVCCLSTVLFRRRR